MLTQSLKIETFLHFSKIPNTNLQLKKTGHNINIEFDILAKYVEKSLSIKNN